MVYDGARQTLERSLKGIRCRDVLRILKSLKFNVKDCQAGHKVFTHPGIPDFHGSDFNCGHSNHNQVLPIYTKRILDIIVRYEQEIKRYLGESDNV